MRIPLGTWITYSKSFSSRKNFMNVQIPVPFVTEAENVQSHPKQFLLTPLQKICHGHVLFSDTEKNYICSIFSEILNHSKLRKWHQSILRYTFFVWNGSKDQLRFTDGLDIMSKVTDKYARTKYEIHLNRFMGFI